MEAAYYNNLGLALGGAKKLDEAKVAFETAAMMDPMKAGDYLFNEGAMYNNNNDYPKAIEAFNKTLEKDPNNKSAMLQIALSYMGTEATMPKAVPILEKFLTLNPTKADADLAKAYLEAIQQTAPTEYKSEKAIADEKAKAEKAAAAQKGGTKAPPADKTKKVSNNSSRSLDPEDSGSRLCIPKTVFSPPNALITQYSFRDTRNYSRRNHRLCSCVLSGDCSSPTGRRSPRSGIRSAGRTAGKPSRSE